MASTTTLFDKARRRDATTAWLERTNPLAGLSIRAAMQIYDAARGGDYSRIQYLYAEIEATNPVLLTCVERRSAALSSLGWKVATLCDGAEADEQKEALEKALAGAEGLDEAIEHLSLAFFRGFSHVRPVWDGRGSLAAFERLDGWNFARDIATRRWYWNGGAAWCDPSRPDPALVPVPPRELCSVERRREIDRPALALALRLAVGERDWGRFVERYGIPFVLLTAPDTTPQERMQEFADAAAKIADGLSSAIPAGTGVNFADGARGTDPFTPFVDHVQKLIVLMATGGTLTSLAESGAGTLAGGAQMEVWEQIVKRDSVAIGAALNRSVCREVLEALFPGREQLVKFELGGDRQLSPEEIFDVAAKARAAGYRISKDELEKATGYTLEAETAPGAEGEPSAPWQNAAPGGASRPGEPSAPWQNAAPGGASRPGEPIREALEAYRADLGPVAKELEALLGLPDKELPAAAAALSRRLPELLGAPDSEFSAFLYEEIAAAMASAAGQEPLAQNSAHGESEMAAKRLSIATQEKGT